MRDDFIFYTNFIEGRGYEISKDFVKGGCIGKFRFNKGKWTHGKKVYKSQLECQKATATAIYNRLKGK
jgi:hypothetical protein